MPKKQKRQVSRSTAPVVSQPTAPKTNVSAAQAPVTRTFTSSRTSIVEFNPDYSYVRSDLKRISVLAGSFISILVILSFFLR